MTKLTEAISWFLEEQRIKSNLVASSGSFKSGWLAALEEVAKGVQATKGNDYSGDNRIMFIATDARESLRDEMAKVLEGLKS